MFDTALHNTWEMRELDRHLDQLDPITFLEYSGWTEIGTRKDGTRVWKKKQYGKTIIKTEDEAIEWEDA